MRSNYHTKQKEELLKIIKKKNKEFTIKELFTEMNKEVGLTTIYRFIDNLIKEGRIEKTIGPNNTVFYQYMDECKEENHFFLKCDNCGKMIHIDCNCIKELSNHINEKHKFNLKRDNIIISGLCNNCNKKNKEVIS